MPPRQKLLSLAEAIPGTAIQTPDGPGYILRCTQKQVHASVWKHFPATPDHPRGYWKGSPAHDNWMSYISGRSKVTFAEPSVAKTLKPLFEVRTDQFDIRSGTDPEVFVEDAIGVVVPAWSFLPDKHGKSAIYWDGVQAEFRTRPWYCLEEECRAIGGKLHDLEKKLPEGTKLSTKSVVEIPKNILMKAREEHVRLGCDPSYNAYGVAGEEVPDGRDLKLRFAGGHIHFGTTWVRSNYHREHVVLEAVKTMDALIGVASVSLFEKLSDPRRRRYYGLAGEYRLPKHGLEYRVLDNSWLRHSRIYHLTFTLAREAFRMGMLGWRKLLDAPEDEVQSVINDSDVTGARKLLARNREIWKGIVDRCYKDWSAKTIEMTHDALAKGVHNFVAISEIDVHSFRANDRWASEA